MKDPLFTCEICGISGTDQSVILKGYCHRIHTGGHSYNKSHKKKPPSSPKGMGFDKWRKMFNEKEKADN